MSDLRQRYAREPRWAVVGASNDRGKFGNRIYRTLRAAGYQVTPVNRHRARIEGDPAYADLAELPEVPTVVNLVIPPGPDTLRVVQEARDRGVRALWFQPGAEEAEAIHWARSRGMDVIEDCILVHHVQHPVAP